MTTSIPAEAYLYLLECYQGERKSHPTHRDLELKYLKALALVCVSEPKGEVFAIGLQRPSPQHPTAPVKLFVAGHSEVPDSTRIHLRDICDRLVSISKLKSDCHKESDCKNNDIRAQQHDLLLVVLQFCHDEIARRFQQRDDTWKDYMAHYKSRLIKGGYKDQMATFDTVMKLIDGTYEYYVGAAETLQPARMQAVLAEMVNVPFRAAIRDIDRRLGGRSLESYINDVTDHYRSVNMLVRVALSRRLEALFHAAPELEFLTSHKQAISFDLRPIQTEFPHAFADHGLITPYRLNRIKSSYEAYPHCELTLVAWFVQHRNTLSSISPSIGVSKPSCFACELGLQALNLYLPKVSPGLLPAFRTAGEHDELYPQSAYPRFFPDDKHEHDFKSILSELARERFTTELDQFQNTRSSSSRIPGPSLADALRALAAEEEQE